MRHNSQPIRSHNQERIFRRQTVELKIAVRKESSARPDSRPTPAGVQLPVPLRRDAVRLPVRHGPDPRFLGRLRLPRRNLGPQSGRHLRLRGRAGPRLYRHLCHRRPCGPPVPPQDDGGGGRRRGPGRGAGAAAAAAPRPAGGDPAVVGSGAAFLWQGEVGGLRAAVLPGNGQAPFK
jgi:hypothetical protein